MKLFKKLMCLVLGTTITAVFSACNSTPAGDSPSPDKMSAKGRYVEEMLPLPKEAGTNVSLIHNADGSLEYFGFTYSEPDFLLAKYVSSDGQSWEKKELPWYDKLISDRQGVHGIYDIVKSSTGEYYLLFSDSQANLRLYRVSGETASEVLIPSWDDKESSAGNNVIFSNGAAFEMASGKSAETADSESAKEVEQNETQISARQSLYASQIQIDENDNLYILFSSGSRMNGLYHYNLKDGSVISQYPSINGSFVIQSGKIFGLSDDRKSIQAVDLETGKQESAIPLNEMDYFTSLAKGTNDDIYICNKGGIQRIAAGGSLLENLMDASMSTLGIPSMTFCRFVSDGSGGFYLSFVDNDRADASLIHVYYDKDMPSVPDKELVVYSLYESKTVRQAIGSYQQKHPDVKVNYQVGMDEESGTVESDVIRALGTEIMAGKGPDILILDGLPLESYIEKNVLTDLSSLANSLEDNDLYFPFLKNSFAKDNQIFALPSRFSFPAVIGDKELLSNLNSLDTFMQKGETSLLAVQNSKNLLEALAPLYYHSWTNEAGVLNQQAISDFYEQAKKLFDVNDSSKNMASGGGIAIYSVSLSGGITLDENLSEVMMGKAQSCIIDITGLTQLSFGIGNGDNVLAPIPTKEQNVFLPKISAGVLTTSKQQELAMEFIRSMLSYDVQKYDFGDGFSANEQAYQKQVNDLKSEAKKQGQDFDLSAFEAMLNSISVPVIMDNILLNEVIEQGNSYLTGQKTLEKACTDLSSKMAIYLAE